MASKVQQNLLQDFKVQGHIKPGASAAAVLKTPTQEIGELTKNATVVEWCDTGDVGRNDTQNGLHHIQSFVERYQNTNVMVINVPNRYDLQVDSCVKKEVKTFNRKLSKQLKLLNNAHMMEVNYDRDHKTRTPHEFKREISFSKRNCNLCQRYIICQKEGAHYYALLGTRCAYSTCEERKSKGQTR
jgi:hypothetical protein